MARNSEDTTFILNSKSALPNKLLQNDGTVTDLIGNQVINPVDSYKTKPALPNKFLNPDGTYSTLNEIIAGSVDTSLFVIVEELPTSGNEQKIYLVPDDKGGFVEYHWTGDKWDPIGTVEIDLSNYSTTQEMINAIEAAALTTLNSAKLYTDEQIAGINSEVQVYYWDGNTQQAGITFWQMVAEANKNADIIVNGKSVVNSTSTSQVFAIVPKGKIYNDLITYGVSNILFMYQTSATHTNSFTELFDNASQVQLSDVSKEGIIKQVTHRSNAFTYKRAQYLDTSANYSTPYTPQYPGSPATKKYVDDAIAANITDMLGGSY